MINSGALLLRNSVWSERFLSHWWSIQDRRLLSDQEQFDYLYQQLLQSPLSVGSSLNSKTANPNPTANNKQPHLQYSPPPQNRQYLLAKIHVLPPYALNSDPPAMVKQSPHHNVLHLMVMDCSLWIGCRRD
jgi:hypothetical protein